jgi:hypothetical protein
MSWLDFATHLLAIHSLSPTFFLLPHSVSLLLRKPAHIPLGRGACGWVSLDGTSRGGEVEGGGGKAARIPQSVVRGYHWGVNERGNYENEPQLLYLVSLCTSWASHFLGPPYFCFPSPNPPAPSSSSLSLKPSLLLSRWLCGGHRHRCHPLRRGSRHRCCRPRCFHPLHRRCCCYTFCRC